MFRQNCWEFMKCGREIGGNNADTRGVCPIAAETVANGLNGGINGGRLCWVIVENNYKDRVKCSDIHRGEFCFQCEFRYKVKMQEGLLNICNATGRFLALSDYISRGNYIEKATHI